MTGMMYVKTDYGHGGWMYYPPWQHPAGEAHRKAVADIRRWQRNTPWHGGSGNFAIEYHEDKLAQIEYGEERRRRENAAAREAMEREIKNAGTAGGG